jgi:hypothetical protein
MICLIAPILCVLISAGFPFFFSDVGANLPMKDRISLSEIKSSELADMAETKPDSASPSIGAMPADPAHSASSIDSSWWYRKLDNRAFGVGERLEFDVKYGKLPAGIAVMEIPEIIDFDGKKCFRISSIASSNNFVSVFYKVRDSVETIIDKDGIFPRQFRKKLHEGGYKIDRATFFDQRDHISITGRDTIPTYAFVQDPLSSLFFIRTRDLVVGNDIFIDNHTDKKNYPLKVIVQKKERIKVPAGEFDCIVIEPVMRAEGIFKAKGSIRIWLTDDQYKMPVMMKSEVFFLGSISAQLSKYTRGQIEANLE